MKNEERPFTRTAEAYRTLRKVQYAAIADGIETGPVTAYFASAVCEDVVKDGSDIATLQALRDFLSAFTKEYAVAHSCATRGDAVPAQCT